MIKFLKKKKINILLILICLFFLLNKNNSIKDLYNILNFNEDTRITKTYGYCGGESIGYLRYLKKKYNFKSNPKIINFIHLPVTKWSIFDSNYNDKISNFEILINYPGEQIITKIPLYKERFYELKKESYLFGFISKNSLKIILADKTIDEINLQFYNKTNLGKMNKIGDVNIKKSSKDKNFLINNFNNYYNFSNDSLYLKLISKKGIYLNNNLEIIFQNKYQINQSKILDNHKNCYLIKKI